MCVCVCVRFQCHALGTPRPPGEHVARQAASTPRSFRSLCGWRQGLLRKPWIFMGALTYLTINNDWLVVSTILKNVSQWEGLSHILWKINNV